jgi:tyrosinase
MTFVRRNVYELGAPWADPILWYARGVGAMKARHLDNPTSWNFYGAIHGFDNRLWTKYGYYSATGPQPTQPDIDRYLFQCQHGSWYFLPWHRGYLLAFEANIRAEVVALGGPPDWALPYWNYFKTGQDALPPAFNSESWPDGASGNPLYVDQRYGPQNNGNVYVPIGDVNMDALSDPDFTGVTAGSPGFGGLDTGFAHGGQFHGGIETQPHDYVHGLVGGGTRLNPGLMANPNTAGLDPIFWLHHANIDRLWAAWNASGKNDPTDPNWVNGPGNVGERIFSLPMPNAVPWDYTPGEMVNMAGLGYEYDDLTPAGASPQPFERLVTLGASKSLLKSAHGVLAMTSGRKVEMVGANEAPLSIVGEAVNTQVRLDPTVRKKVKTNLMEAAALESTGSLDRVFLNLENVRGLADTTAFRVYIDLPDGADPAEHPERLAGSIALFGVSSASPREDAPEKARGLQAPRQSVHGGSGLSYSLEITRIVDALHLENKLDVNKLNVRIVPVRSVPEEDKVSIGRISIHRQGR